MLSFGAGSFCDVCFETFGQDSKAPCSIPCGHVFCVGCISNVRCLLCPLCRQPFEHDSIIKLHMDLDAIPIPPEQTSDSQLDENSEAAQRLHKSIARIADVGIEEQELRRLIQETKNFLQGKPRHLYHDLRVAHRMVAYMCGIKSELRSQKSSNDTLSDQIKALTAEKEDLLSKLHKTEQDRTYERDTALAVEKSLREHNALAVRNYHVLIEVYNKLAQSTAELLKNVPLSCPSEKSADPGGNMTRVTVPALPPLDMLALEGVAVRDSESSFLISPLPQFTNALPSVLSGITPLPELTEDIDGEKEEEEEEEISTPDSVQHDRSIDGRQEFHRQSGETVLSEHSEHFKSLQVSVFSHRAPFHRARSHSIPSHSTSPGSPPSGRSASTSPPKLVLQDLTPISPDRYPHPRETYTSRNSNPDGDALRSRLHDLLRDSPTSSSLPNMTSGHLSPLFNKVDRESTSPNTSGSLSSSYTGSKTSVSTNNLSDSFSHLLASGPQSSNRLAPVPSPIPFIGQRYSSASTEAKKLEEERRRKYLEEKHLRREERYKAEKQRDDKLREERADNERLYPNADREYPAKVSPSTISPVMPSRRDQPLTSNQNYIHASSNAVSPLKRRPSTGNAVPPIPVSEHASGQHGRYAPPSSGGHKSRPVPIPTNPAHIYS